MAPDERGPGSKRIDRRSVLQGVAGAGLLLGTGTASAGQDALVLGYLAVEGNVVGRRVVVYREPTRADEGVCDLPESWRHPVVSPGAGPTDEPVHTTVHADDRFAPGTVLAVVDRIQGCDRDGTTYAGVFLEVVAEPPDEGD